MDFVTHFPTTSEYLQGIIEIEFMSFSYPWDEETFITTLEDETCISAIAIEDGIVIGYCLALGITSMVHILNLAVHPRYRRRGIAKQLVLEILMDAAVKDKLYAVLEVRKSNVPARTLYASMGFSHVSTWHRYYSDTNEDAAVMVKDLRSSEMKDVQCTVVHNDEVANQTFHMVIEGDLPLFMPGQFSMVQVSSTNEPFLRRPLAILSQKSKQQELLYRVKGEGTLVLSKKKKGESVKVLGPLGKGFTRHDGKDIIYIAGGTGLPPIFSLAERIRSGRFIIGAKSKHDIPLIERIKTIPNTEVIVLTEDGSLGNKGLATDALKDITVPRNQEEDMILYACGPDGMLREASNIASKMGILCEVSLEARMSCGFGACNSCSVKTIKGNQRVCREGPVFNALDLIWS